MRCFMFDGGAFFGDLDRFYFGWVLCNELLRILRLKVWRSFSLCFVRAIDLREAVAEEA